MSLFRLKAFHAGYGSTDVLHGIDLYVDEGEIIVLLGANGAGKTTLLRAISRLVRGKGTMTLNGDDVLRRRPDQVVRLGIAHVPEGRGMFSELTVRENLRAGGYLRPRDSVETDVDEWLEIFPNLGSRADQAAGSLSGGEQQMVAVARGLMSRPKLLLLDEPSLGLAPKIVESLFDSLAAINRDRGTSMMIVEQNAQIALNIAHRGYVLERGSIVSEGDAASLAQDDSIRLAYLGV